MSHIRGAICSTKKGFVCRGTAPPCPNGFICRGWACPSPKGFKNRNWAAARGAPTDFWISGQFVNCPYDLNI